MLLGNRITKNTKNRECKITIQMQIQIASSIQIQIPLNLHCNKSNLQKSLKATILTIGNSLISRIDEKHLISKLNVEVTFFPGASTEDMIYDYLKPLLKKVPEIIILHSRTNKCVHESSYNVLDKILSLKQCAKKNLPESKIIILNIIERTDNGKKVLFVKRLNKHLCSLEVDIVDNSNIGKECLDKKVLHLNPRRSGKIAINLIKIDKTIEVGS